MSEQSTEATATGADAEQSQNQDAAPQQVDAPKPTETVEFWKQKAREQEGRAKSNAEAAKRLQEIEDAQKSEQQRLADRQAAIERERDEARAEGIRYKAAARHGIGEDYFDLLGSGDEETVTARAERIGHLLRTATEHQSMQAELEALRAGKPAPTSGRPTASLKPGATAEQITSEQDDSYPASWLPRQS